MCEDSPCCGCGCGDKPDEFREAELREQALLAAEHRGFPGDGSGEDDFADYNNNKRDNYRNKGNEDAVLDQWFEDRCDGGE